MISEIEKRYINRLELKTKLYQRLQDGAADPGPEMSDVETMLAELDKKEKNAVEKLKEMNAILE